MIHPSYVELMKVVNNNVEIGEEPVVNSRYSIVAATAKRARQLIDGNDAMVEIRTGEKPLSVAVRELYQGDLEILSEEAARELDEREAAFIAAKEAEEAQKREEREKEKEKEKETVEKE